MGKLIELNNYTISELLMQPPELIEDYIAVLKNLKPKPLKQPLTDMALGDVDLIKQNIDDENEYLNIISMVQGIDIKEVKKLKILDFFPILKQIRNEVTTINNRETNALRAKHIDLRYEMVNAGERLEKFGIYNVLDSLSGGDILKYDEIRQLPYKEVFIKLLLDKENGDIQYEVNKLKPIGEK